MEIFPARSLSLAKIFIALVLLCIRPLAFFVHPFMWKSPKYSKFIPRINALHRLRVDYLCLK
uniref:Uncharacterized protein n=1 Tax=Glossina morsitans morsitans TaxID=37546 RepID=A0A1B0GFY9_GLOMM